ncbi:MAG: DUF928 domain-containing protein [Coleofasciculus sp. G1-WW12-02]|uniref:DUF928 domain-containing protein n=1 Tax=Coleofasciculus sp. G1-WW12-02 TaxID=3068483 RepID=UPI0032F696A7
MVWTKLPQYLMVLSASVLLELGIIPGFFIAAQAQTRTSSNSQSKQVIFKPNPNQPAPVITTGGGRRILKPCSGDQSEAKETTTAFQSLTVLIPSPSVLDAQLLNESEPSPVGVNFQLTLTVSEKPTFLVYVPPISAQILELKVEDEKGKQIGETARLNLTETPGIYRISLSETTPPLVVGNDYKWLVSIPCQVSGPNDPFVEGLIRRVSPDSILTGSLDQVTDLELVAVYAEAGIWQDAVVNLAALRQTQPNNPEVVSAWESLLKYADLEDITNAPLISNFEDIQVNENNPEEQE